MLTGPAACVSRARIPSGVPGPEPLRRDLDCCCSSSCRASWRGDRAWRPRGRAADRRGCAPSTRRRSRGRVRRSSRDDRAAGAAWSSPRTDVNRASHSALGLIAASPRRPRRWAIGAYFEGVDGLTRWAKCTSGADAYIGVAPVPGGLANVCLVVPEARARAAMRRRPRRSTAALTAIRCSASVSDARGV